jgi:ABC-type antimicrobial peptide transport system permease subunit
MTRFSALALRNLWARKLRTLVTGFGIVLGVTTVLAIGITNATVEESLNDFFSQVSGDADLTVKDAGEQSFRDRTLAQVRAMPGVLFAIGSLWQGGSLALGEDDKNVLIVGIDPELDPLVRAYTLTEGSFISTLDRTYTIVLVKTFADDNDITLGDDVQLRFDPDQEETLRVVGFLSSDGLARWNNGAIGFVRLDAAQAMFNQSKRLTQIDLVAEPALATDKAALEDLQQQLDAALGDDYSVEFPAAIGQSITESMAGLRTALGVFSVIALFVGALLIYNTFTMTVTERRREIGMLRAVGATRGQVLRLMLIEAGLMGLLGALLGLGGGVLLAFPLIQYFARGFGGEIELNAYTIPPESAVQGVAVGLVVTLFAAFVPAWQAGRISPVEAMRPHADKKAGFFITHGWQVGLILLAFGLNSLFIRLIESALHLVAPGLSGTVTGLLSLILLAAGVVIILPRLGLNFLRRIRLPLLNRLLGHGSGARTGHVWVIGAMLIAMGVGDPVWDVLPDAMFFIVVFSAGTFLIPITIQLLEHSARQPLTSLYGQAGNLGSRNLNRAKGRTSLTVSVLMVGAVMTIAIGSMNAAFKKTLHEWVDTALGGDLSITAEQFQRLDVMNQIQTVPGVELTTPLQIVSVGVVASISPDGLSKQDDTVAFMAVDLPTYYKVAGIQFTEDAEQARLSQGDAVFISTVMAAEYGVSRGGFIRMRTRRGERDFEVAGIVNNFMWGGRSVIGTWSDMERYLGQDKAWRYLVKLAPGAEAATVKRDLEDRLNKRGSFEVESADTFRQSLARDVEQFFAIFNVIVYISVIVAALGVVNTMTMNILERVREIGMLRSIGMTRGQVSKMILAEAAAMGVIGGLFGLSLGYLISENMVIGMSEGSGWQFDYVFPQAALISAVVTVLVVSQLAALYPVWRAAGVRIVEAISHE